MVIVCESCGRENEDEFKFCLGCGGELSPPQQEEEDEGPKMVDCPHCESRVPGGFKFCGQCGGTLEEPAADTAAEAQPETEPPTSSTDPEPVETPSQDSPRLGELTVIRPDGTEGANIPLTSEGLVLGRNSDFDVLADDPYLSARHAEIRYQDGVLVLKDLDSDNGVFWRLQDDVELQSGDLLRIGQELLRFEAFSDVAPVGDAGSRSDVKIQGSPDPGIWGRLSLVGGPGVETRAFAISGDGATIGREIGAILFRDDGFVSGKHAKLYRDDGTIYFRDLGSSNGSYIRLREDRRLDDGDLMLMGQQLLRLTLN